MREITLFYNRHNTDEYIRLLNPIIEADYIPNIRWVRYIRVGTETFKMSCTLEPYFHFKQEDTMFTNGVNANVKVIERSTPRPGQEGLFPELPAGHLALRTEDILTVPNWKAKRKTHAELDRDYPEWREEFEERTRPIHSQPQTTEEIENAAWVSAFFGPWEHPREASERRRREETVQLQRQGPLYLPPSESPHIDAPDRRPQPAGRLQAVRDAPDSTPGTRRPGPRSNTGQVPGAPPADFTLEELMAEAEQAHEQLKEALNE